MPRDNHQRLPSSPAILLSLLTAGMAGVVLWLVLHATASERLAERERWREAGRQRLDASARRIREAWQQRMAAAEQLRELPPPEAFQIIVRDALADSAVLPGTPAVPSYPALPAARGMDGGAGEADARLEELRGFLAAKDWPSAEALAQGWFAEHRDALTRSGRHAALAADLLLLMAHQREKRAAPDWLTVRMETELNTYRGSALSSPQRTYLMEELAAQTWRRADAVFPTFAAEQMALSHLSGGRSTAVEVTLNRVMLLFTRASLAAALTRNAEDPAAVIRPPASETGTAEVAEIHASLPGWRVALTPQQPASSRVPGLALAGGAATLALGALTFLTWRTVQRQLRRARLQEDLAATVSHELRTPVASMRVLAESLLEEAAPAPEKTREYLGLIARENLRLSRLIENFLTLARMERGRMRGEVLAVSDIIAQTAAAAYHLAPRLRLQTPLPDALVCIAPAAAEAALLNLLENAAKFSPPGTPVEWGADLTGGAVRFFVTDHGPGLTPDARVWEPFERGDSPQPGCGLGLAIVQRLAAQAGGSVQVESVPGSGSTFRILLPSVKEGTS